MGIFDGFVTSEIKLDPQTTLAAGMIYLSAADGHLSEDERFNILKVIPSDQVLQRGLNYCRRNSVQQFIQQAASILTPQQKMCMLLNMADMAMGDGDLAEQERALLVRFQQAFGIPDSSISVYIQGLMQKNNLAVFGF